MTSSHPSRRPHDSGYRSSLARGWRLAAGLYAVPGMTFVGLLVVGWLLPAVLAITALAAMQLPFYFVIRRLAASGIHEPSIVLREMIASEQLRRASKQ